MKPLKPAWRAKPGKPPPPPPPPARPPAAAYLELQARHKLWEALTRLADALTTAVKAR